MAKRRRRGARRRKRDDLATLAVAGVVSYVLLVPTLGVAFVVLLEVSALMLWVMFGIPTWCDYDVDGRGCTRPVYGKLNGCWQHARLKRDAMWAAIGRRNPGMAFRLTWMTDHARPSRRVGGAPSQKQDKRVDRNGDPISDKAAKQGAYNVSMWVFTAISAVAAVAALFLPK